MTNPTIQVYSLPDLKNTTDDALPNYLTSLKFEQSHFLTDVRLALGYSAITIAAITFYFDYTLGWDKTKEYTLWAVLAYFTLNGALTLWTWFAEKGKIFTGERNGTILTIASHVPKHKPIYNLKVRYNNAKTDLPFDWQELEISAPFTKWFAADGQFIAKPFQDWLAAEVPIVGQAAAKNAGKRDDQQALLTAAGISTIDESKSPATTTRARKSKEESKSKR